ncbi:Protein involved in formate dehydrogenase formation [Acididesulfobacillus acetoxydans]|uniref:Protein involved in formate dehydrogenase formation n=1 Tax=Acididesulfobacillus acetoxydans TaxID=1561005 RepID=A0A8S0X642_9FIRM|nr:formate dehydrogenase accessory protein FdhE [Acididesulfobacillus acetoxydans]CAA7602190.1 Protein involved in formate dehydrogenase formation [Acididesulfobacillus acetoxydans]CEJ08746.1 Protein involved in formate dehydrogenase formation [Acididesulfobacillus acetoxydans]
MSEHRGDVLKVVADGVRGQRQKASRTEEPDLGEARRIYRLLQEIVLAWQAENASASGDLRSKRSADARETYDDGRREPESRAIRPYFTIGRLPEKSVIELWHKLNAASGRACSPEETVQRFEQFKASGTLAEADMLGRLRIALAGVAGLARRQYSAEELEAAGHNWLSPVCPVCGEQSLLSLVLPPVGKRHLFCRVCGHEWAGKRVGCILCGSEQAKEQTYLRSESYPGVEIVVCQTCGGYFKEFDARERWVDDWVWEDIRTLPLDYAAEKWLAESASCGEPG